MLNKSTRLTIILYISIFLGCFTQNQNAGNSSTKSNQNKEIDIQTLVKPSHCPDKILAKANTKPSKDTANQIVSILGKEGYTVDANRIGTTKLYSIELIDKASVSSNPNNKETDFPSEAIKILDDFSDKQATPLISNDTLKIEGLPDLAIQSIDEIPEADLTEKSSKDTSVNQCPSPECNNWGYEKVGFDKVVVRKNIEPVTVAILGTGLDLKNKFNIWKAPKDIKINENLKINCLEENTSGVNFTVPSGNKNRCNPRDDHGHETRNTIGLFGNENIFGKYSDKLIVLPIKILNNKGSGCLSSAIKAWSFIGELNKSPNVKNKIRIVNNSFGFVQHFSRNDKLATQLSINALIDTLENNKEIKSLLLIISAGNNKEDINVNKIYPGSVNYPNIITVAGSNKNDKLYCDGRTGGSNFGSNTVDVAAPSERLSKGKAVCKPIGTSASAPFVSAAAALILATCNNPNLSAVDLKNSLEETTDKIYPKEPPSPIRKGRINVENAVKYCLETFSK